ncbi:MAG: hypothetical protein OR994_04395 [Candidatus Poseidoniales archaeon]|jgi:hypothetical protein|nr:hypothetical protein [Candidatus Poseidoniales archaeon]|tara:strand:- start:1265 stop:1912 length:648 start_codon:yes stop_codon:yes gene_type:complete
MTENEIPLDIDHATHSVGGLGGHFFRRFTHVIMAIIPILYFTKGEQISNIFSLTPTQFVTLACLILVFLEMVRLYFGIIIVGQREYEAKQISALAWGAFAVCLALLLSPESNTSEGMKSGIYAAPLIWGLTFVDPIMGEIKRSKRGIKAAIIGGLFVSYTIWFSCSYFLGTPMLASIILAPLTVLGELPSVKWIDDNATMVLLPLTILLIIEPFL